MKALVLEATNTPLALRNLPTPQPGPGQALVRVKAAALNHRDVYIQQGKYPGIVLPGVLGSDGAGVVEAVGPGAGAAWVGRAVVIDPGLGWGPSQAVQAPTYTILGMPTNGTLAEFVVVPAENLHPKPEHLSWEQAAALPLAGVTAWRALMSRAQLAPAERLLVTGIGAGTALAALQFGVAHGAEVYVTSSSPEKLERARQLGAKGGSLYTQPNWADELEAAANGLFDVVIDSAGGEGFGQLAKLTNAGGRIAFFGGTRGKWPALLPQALFWKQISILGSTMGSPDDFAAMMRFVAKHKLAPVVDRVFPLDEGEAAFRHLDAGAQCGKVVVVV
jgi:NADPH:quinone reductase-like Zn-dependent oxidoreductase